MPLDFSWLVLPENLFMHLSLVFKCKLLRYECPQPPSKCLPQNCNCIVAAFL